MNKRLLGIKELTEYLGITRSTLYTWVHERRLPYLKLGKLVKFDPVEIDGWMEDYRIEAQK